MVYKNIVLPNPKSSKFRSSAIDGKLLLFYWINEISATVSIAFHHANYVLWI